MHNNPTHKLTPIIMQEFGIGKLSRDAIEKLLQRTQTPLFEEVKIHDDNNFWIFEILKSMHQHCWNDTEMEMFFSYIYNKKTSGQFVNLEAINKWIIKHEKAKERVLLIFACIDTIPPDDIEIQKAHSISDNERKVFIASWKLIQKDVICKHIQKAICPERQDIPTILPKHSHQNIVQTHYLHNKNGELFLIEGLPEEILSSKWIAKGTQDTINLLYDIASALKYLQEHNRAHANIKPQNIGRMHNRYILLDFGACQPISDLTNKSPYGSLRTRAPELFETDEHTDPICSDIWSLGATVFSALTGRFPLFKANETLPPKGNTNERDTFKLLLATRIKNEWGDFVKLDELSTEIQELFGQMLERDPKSRISLPDLLMYLEKKFGALISRSIEKATIDGRFSPSEELKQLKDFINAIQPDSIVPYHKYIQFKERLKELSTTDGFTKQQQLLVIEMLTQIEVLK